MMKRITNALLVLMCISILCSCGSEEQTNETNTDVTTRTEISEEQKETEEQEESDQQAAPETEENSETQDAAANENANEISDRDSAADASDREQNDETQVQHQTNTDSDTKYDTDFDNSEVTIPEYEDHEGNLVWVPINGGTKYHIDSGCSEMVEPMQVTVEHAEALGYTACKLCFER